MREVKYLVTVLPTPKPKGSLALTEVSGSFACQEKKLDVCACSQKSECSPHLPTAAKLLGVSVRHLCDEEVVVAAGTPSGAPPLVTET